VALIHPDIRQLAKLACKQFNRVFTQSDRYK
jgi:hypothetical protein